MIDDELLKTLLNIPEIEVKRIVLEQKRTLKIYVKSTQQGTLCHRCGRRIDQPYGYAQEVELRHLPVFEYKTFIVIRPQRYQCRHCEGHPTTTQTQSWYTPKSHCTHAFEQDILRALINSTITDVSLTHEIGADAVQGILDRQIETQVDWDAMTTLDIIGVDEIALQKGHGDFVVLVSARVEDQLHLLGVLKDRKKETVKDFFLSIPKRLRRTVKIVCSDLYSGFIGAAKAVFGSHVAICADRFHVAKLYRESVETLRKREMTRLRRELDQSEYATFHHVHWIIRKAAADLTSDEQRILNRLFTHSPRLQQAYALREALTAIFESPLSPGQAKRRIRGWMCRVKNRKLHCFDGFLRTLDRYWTEITNYFGSRQTSGFVEGLNNKIKVIKRRCYGITNLRHLFQRVCLDLTGHARFGFANS